MARIVQFKWIDSETLTDETALDALGGDGWSVVWVGPNWATGKQTDKRALMQRFYDTTLLTHLIAGT